jgi:hypothetical protein
LDLVAVLTPLHPVLLLGDLSLSVGADC